MQATSPAYVQPPQVSPRQSVQPWDIPTRSPRASSPSGGRPLATASLEWDMIKAGMTARAEQKRDYDVQGNAVDSHATLLPGLRMGLPIENAGLNINNTSTSYNVMIGQSAGTAITNSSKNTLNIHSNIYIYIYINPNTLILRASVTSGPASIRRGDGNCNSLMGARCLQSGPATTLSDPSLLAVERSIAVGP